MIVLFISAACAVLIFYKLYSLLGYYDEKPTSSRATEPRHAIDSIFDKSAEQTAQESCSEEFSPGPEKDRVIFDKLDEASKASFRSAVSAGNQMDFAVLIKNAKRIFEEVTKLQTSEMRAEDMRKRIMLENVSGKAEAQLNLILPSMKDSFEVLSFDEKKVEGIKFDPETGELFLTVAFKTKQFKSGTQGERLVTVLRKDVWMFRAQPDFSTEDNWKLVEILR